MSDRELLIKALKLQKYFDYAKVDKNHYEQTLLKFTSIWGSTIAESYLKEYEDALMLILDMDEEDLNRFIKEF